MEALAKSLGQRISMFWRTSAPTRRPAGFIEPCIPTIAHKPPVGPQWVHEIKHDGFRLIVCRRAGRVRLFTRRGYDWSKRYPLIVESAEALTRDFTIDGEVVVCDDAGVADFERLQARMHDRPAFLCAFDLLEFDGHDLRPFQLEHAKMARPSVQGLAAIQTPPVSTSVLDSLRESGVMQGEALN